jgi:hypothetical protein
MDDWYGPPIAIGNVPGSVSIGRHGDLFGKCYGGGFMSLFEYQLDRLIYKFKRMTKLQRSTLNMAGFSSLSDLISEVTVNAKRQDLFFQKAGPTNVVGASHSLWTSGVSPAAGSNGAAAPGGTAHTKADTGSMPFTNPTGGDTTHVITAWNSSSVAAKTLLLYDRLFSVAKTMSSVTTEAVTGVPTRYQSTTSGAVDSIEGNFLFIECTGALSATAHNWTVCQYKDQANNTAENLPSVTGNSSNIAQRLDHPVGRWYCPLNSGDTGIRNLTQMQCSGSVTGTINFVIGHPLVWIPAPIAFLSNVVDCINTAFSMPRVFDDACLALLEVHSAATTATNYCGSITIASG